MVASAFFQTSFNAASAFLYACATQSPISTCDEALHVLLKEVGGLAQSVAEVMDGLTSKVRATTRRIAQLPRDRSRV
jgi:hypothetical protein